MNYGTFKLNNHFKVLLLIFYFYFTFGLNIMLYSSICIFLNQKPIKIFPVNKIVEKTIKGYRWK